MFAIVGYETLWLTFCDQVVLNNSKTQTISSGTCSARYKVEPAKAVNHRLNNDNQTSPLPPFRICLRLLRQRNSFLKLPLHKLTASVHIFLQRYSFSLKSRRQTSQRPKSQSPQRELQ